MSRVSTAKEAIRSIPFASLLSFLCSLFALSLSVYAVDVFADKINTHVIDINRPNEAFDFVHRTHYGVKAGLALLFVGCCFNVFFSLFTTGAIHERFCLTGTAAEGHSILAQDDEEAGLEEQGQSLRESSSSSSLESRHGLKESQQSIAILNRLDPRLVPIYQFLARYYFLVQGFYVIFFLAFSVLSFFMVGIAIGLYVSRQGAIISCQSPRPAVELYCLNLKQYNTDLVRLMCNSDEFASFCRASVDVKQHASNFVAGSIFFAISSLLGLIATAANYVRARHTRTSFLSAFHKASALQASTSSRRPSVNQSSKRTYIDRETKTSSEVCRSSSSSRVEPLDDDDLAIDMYEHHDAVQLSSSSSGPAVHEPPSSSSSTQLSVSSSDGSPAMFSIE